MEARTISALISAITSGILAAMLVVCKYYQLSAWTIAFFYLILATLIAIVFAMYFNPTTEEAPARRDEPQREQRSSTRPTTSVPSRTTPPPGAIPIRYSIPATEELSVDSSATPVEEEEEVILPEDVKILPASGPILGGSHMPTNNPKPQPQTPKTSKQAVPVKGPQQLKDEEWPND